MLRYFPESMKLLSRSKALFYIKVFAKMIMYDSLMRMKREAEYKNVFLFLYFRSLQCGTRFVRCHETGIRMGVISFPVAVFR